MLSSRKIINVWYYYYAVARITLESCQDRKVAALRECVLCYGFFMKRDEQMANFLNKDIFDFLIEKANLASKNNEVPISAIIVDQKNNIISWGINSTKEQKYVHTHAEINAINSFIIKNKISSLKNYSIMCTLEPCLMCLGAIFHAQLNSVSYLLNSDTGAFSTYENLYPIMYNKCGDERQTELYENLLTNFFKKIRSKEG